MISTHVCNVRISGQFVWEELLSYLMEFNFVMITSGWRCNQHSFGSNIYVCVPIWCQWCSNCSCYITVCSTILSLWQITSFFSPGKMEGTLYAKVYNTCLLSLVIVYGGTFCRYFIASILLWRLWLHVDLLPPSLKHLQFGRFLKNGNLFLILLSSN